jgi:hypothetical protein
VINTDGSHLHAVLFRTMNRTSVSHTKCFYHAAGFITSHFIRFLCYIIIMRIGFGFVSSERCFLVCWVRK